jgi:hypothetical protein
MCVNTLSGGLITSASQCAIICRIACDIVLLTEINCAFANPSDASVTHSIINSIIARCIIRHIIEETQAFMWRANACICTLIWLHTGHIVDDAKIRWAMTVISAFLAFYFMMHTGNGLVRACVILASSRVFLMPHHRLANTFIAKKCAVLRPAATAVEIAALSHAGCRYIVVTHKIWDVA